MKKISRPWVFATLLLAALPTLQGCVGVAAVGVGTGALAIFDRRSLGAQTEDETIEWKASNRVSAKFGDFVHVNYTSYNRKVLLTGEVPNEEYKVALRDLVATVENVEGVYDELIVGGISSIAGRTTDTYITSKVKTRLIDNGQVAANLVKVVTEASTVYLLGLVTSREAQAAVEVARTTGGVVRVVNLLDVRSDAEIRKLDATVRGNGGATEQSSRR